MLPEWAKDYVTPSNLQMALLLGVGALGLYLRYRRHQEPSIPKPGWSERFWNSRWGTVLLWTSGVTLVVLGSRLLFER